MKPAFLRIFLILLIFTGSSSCGGDRSRLHIFTWADYVNPAVIEQFEKENNCKVVLDYFDSNEALYAKIKAGAKGYDLYICTSYMANTMYRQKMISPLERGRIPNIGNVDREYLGIALDPGMVYSVPYMFGFVGIAYNREKLKDFRPSWKVFDRADLRGRMTLLNDQRETIGAALKLLGCSCNSTDDRELSAARDVVLRWKKNIAKFDVDEAKRGLDAGEFFVVQAYNGDIVQLMRENRKLALAAPEEGTCMGSDDMVIPSDARNVSLAYAFINFMLDGAVSAKTMEFICFHAPNTAAYKLLDKNFLGNPSIFIPARIRRKSDMLKDLGKDNVKYGKIWDQIRAAQ